jgi:hypothetical protein
LANFPFSLTILLLSPILVAPQIFFGLIFGYLRVRYGFMMGFFMHALCNALLIGLGLLVMSQSTVKVDRTTKDYAVTIKGTFDKYGDSSIKNYPDSLAYENTTLKAVIAYLLNTNESLLKTNNSDRLDSRLDFHFKNKTKDTTKIKSMALEQLMKGYSFSVSKKAIPTNVWDLEITNPSLLAKYKSKDNPKGNEISITKEKLILKNCKIEVLVYALNHAGKNIFLNKTDDDAIYNLTLSLANFETTQKQLEAKYGITLKKRKMNYEHSQITFKESK